LTPGFQGLRYALHTEIHSNPNWNEGFPPKAAFAAGDAGKQGL